MLAAMAGYIHCIPVHDHVFTNFIHLYVLYIQQKSFLISSNSLTSTFAVVVAFCLTKPILLSKYLAQSLVNSTFPSPTGFWLITIPVPVAIATAVLTIPP